LKVAKIRKPEKDNTEMDFADDSERSSQREKTSFMGKLRKSSNAQTAKDTRISGVSHIAVH